MNFSRTVAVLIGATLGAEWVVAQGIDPLSSSPAPRVDLKNVKIEQRLGSQVPPFAEFRDRNGRLVHLRDLLNVRPLIVLPIFYRCTGVCNLELQSLITTLPKDHRRIGKDYDVLVLSIDPNEGAEIAKAKCASTLAAQPLFNGTDAGWHFLTGNLANIRLLTDALGFFFKYDAEKDLINHPSGIIFLTPSGVVSSYILGANYRPDAIALDIDTASKRKVGAKSEEIFFGCVHIDPVTGKRSIVIEGVLRIAGALTVFAVVTTMAALSLGRARRAKRP